MPPKLVAHTGMDALTHSIEAYTSSLRSNFTDPLALKAISMIVEQSINNYSTQSGTVVVVPTGNQGNTDTHTEGIIENVGDVKDIEIRIGEKQRNLPIEIWVNKPNRVKLSIVSPSGEMIDDLEADDGA